MHPYDNTNNSFEQSLNKAIHVEKAKVMHTLINISADEMIDILFDL